MRRLRLLAVPPMAACLLLAAAGLAFAIWSPNSANAGGNSKALSMPSGNTPTVSVSGTSVTVSWSQSTFSGGTAVAGYLAKRYDASTNALQSIGASCSGTISALTCTETSVPVGSWKYAITPKQNSWLGTESAKSSTATVQPTLSSASPSSRGQGASNQNITITGTGFVSGAAATFSASGITVNSTTFVSSTSLTANITVSAGATTGAGNVTVTNPDSGNGSCSGCFAVNAGPTVSSTSPSSRGQGTSSQSITIAGTGFVSGAAATFSGSGITVNSTTFVSSTSLTANITVSAGATTGAGNVTVTNPDAGNGSCSSCFTVNAAPTVSSTSPSSRGQSASNQNITITGTGFASGATTVFSGSGITVNSTTFVSATSLTANIMVSSNAATNARNVTVTNTDAGSGSCSSCFTVNAAPTVSSTSPSSRGQSASNQNVTITGTGFVSGAAATFSASGIAVNSTTFVSSTSLTANITVSSGATTGAGNVTVTNPDAGNGSCISCFTVNAAPTVSSTSPSSRGQGASNQNITVTGTGFVSSAAATFTGSGITVNSTTFVSATSLTANITVSAGATTGAGNVTVTNPDAGNGSCSSCFTVNAKPTVSSTSPSSRGQRAANQNITITGTGFVSGAAATFSASGITVNSTTFVSSTSLTANITVSSSATTGAGNVTVTNPDAGNGSCASCFTVNAAPTITFPTSASKQTVTNGQTVTFTITGTGFVSGATVTISGGFTVNSVTFTDSSHLSVNVKATSGNPNKGTYDLTVTNPDAGWVTSIGSMVNA